MKHRVLIPQDGSEFSRKIFLSVVRLFPPDENDLILLRVSPPVYGVTGKPPQPMSEATPILLFQSAFDIEYSQHPIYATQELASLEAALTDEMENDAQALRREGYTVSTEIRTGQPANEIIKFIENEDVDAVAMTTHGRSGISGAILGGVANQVLRHSTVPVLLFRPKL